MSMNEGSMMSGSLTLGAADKSSLKVLRDSLQDAIAALEASSDTATTKQLVAVMNIIQSIFGDLDHRLTAIENIKSFDPGTA